MRILFIGDVYGSLGRQTLEDHLPSLRDEYGVNYIIVNGENAAHGKGINQKIYKSFMEQGTNVVTLGNHAWDNREIFNFIDDAKRLVRPLNYPPNTPGQGYVISKYNNVKVAVINLMGTTFMNPLANPFLAFDEIYEKIKNETPNIIVDFHAEASSEKIAFGYYVDGRATAVIGTHTHVPTADNRVLPGGTAYITDVGMTGPLDGVIGVQRDAVLKRFVTNLPARFEPVDEGSTQLNAIVFDINEQSGNAISIKRINITEDRML